MLFAQYGCRVAKMLMVQAATCCCIVCEVLQGYLLCFLRSGCGGCPHELEDSGLFFYGNFTVGG